MTIFGKFGSRSLVCLFWCIAQGAALSENVNVEGYYWRDYLGEIPHDAIQGGPDGNGDEIYIGQTAHTGLKGPMLLPGQINAENKTLTFEWGNREHITTENIKVLCTDRPEKFEWLRTTTEAFVKLENESLVVGGYEFNYTVYIGRVMAGGELTIAKVNVAGEKALLHAAKHGKKDFHQKFEILNYNPHIPDVDKIVKAIERKMIKPVKSTSKSGAEIPASLIAFVVVAATCMFFF